jgi:hypothetical protein
MTITIIIVLKIISEEDIFICTIFIVKYIEIRPKRFLYIHLKLIMNLE